MKKQKKTGIGTIILYLLVGCVALYGFAAIGRALDLSYDEEKKEVNFTEVMSSIETTIYDYQGIFENITNEETYCCKITFFGLCGLGIFALLKYTSKKRLHRKGEEHGSARWGTPAEQKKLQDKKRTEEKAIDNNIILTQEVKMSLDTRQHRENLNVLVIGGSGSGKSRFYVKPNVMQLNTSYVITDPKGELLRSTGKMLQDNGYKVKVFNLIDMRHSGNYNPFAYVCNSDGTVNKTYVIKMVNTLMRNTKQDGASGGDQFWEDSTKALISALSFYLLEAGAVDEQNFSNVMQLLKYADVSDDEDYESPLDIKFRELEEENPGSMAVSYYKDFKKAAGETAKSILISCAVRLQAFNLPEVANLTFTDNLALSTIGDEKTALFVIIPSSDTTFNFLAAMMYSQMFDTLYDAANFRHGGRLPIHVRCLLDEFANIGTIPDFDKLLATMRSMEISANVIIQNIAQLKKMYEKSWEIITGNCDSLLFLGGKEETTAEMISKQLGKETIDVIAQNRTKGHRNNSTSINNSIIGRELLTPDEVLKLPTDECILFVRAFPPFLCHKFDIEKHWNYCRLEDSNKSNAFLIDNVKTEEMPSLVYNSDDHIEEAEDIEVDETIKELLQSAKIREVSEIMSDVDIPDDDEFEVEFSDDDTTENNDENDEPSEMKDEPCNFDFTMKDVTENLSIEADDMLLLDKDLFM